MAKPGMKLDKHWSEEDIINIFHEHGGVIKNVAKHLGVSRPCLYDYLDVHPNVKAAQELADTRLDRHVVETAYEGVDKLLENIDVDPSNAFKAINLVLKSSKRSRYYDDRKEKEEAQAIGLVDMKEYSQYIADKSEKEKAKL